MTLEKFALDLQNLEQMPFYPVPAALQIEPSFPEVDTQNFSLFLSSIEQHIEFLLPDSIREQLLYQEDEDALRGTFSRLSKLLPLFKHSSLQKTPTTISISAFCLADFTEGVGRYIGDMLSRWLIPGKQLILVGSRSIAFRFVKYPQQEFFFNEYLIPIKEENEMEIIKSNIGNLLNELRITILAVYYARYIVSIKSLSLEQKTAMIQENISSLLDSPGKIKDSNIFDQMQQFLIKLSAEEKFHQVKQNIAYLLHTRPKAFDRDVFYEVRHFMNAFKDKFTASRNPRHVSRVIAFQYLFKKTILFKVEKEPQERHLSVKLLKTHIQVANTSKKVLGILITMHMLKETERFDKRHILDAIIAIIGEVDYIQDSFTKELSNDSVNSYYLEIDLFHISFDQLKKLKQLLPKELKDRVESVVHPTFMPRNDEEIMKNIIILHKQIRFLRDMPQAIITYDRQLDEQISFQIILVRVVRENSLPMEELLEKEHFAYIIDEIKPLGYLKHRHPKEAVIFRIFLNKTRFFRKDFSLDLHKARNQVVQNLRKMLGEFRDYNGGMIVKQNEALEALRLILRESGKNNDFLLENFFYAIRPGFMQSIIPTEILHRLFTMLMEGLEYDFSTEPMALHIEMKDKYLLGMLCTVEEKMKSNLLKHLHHFNIPSGNLVTCSMSHYEISSLGFMYRETSFLSATTFRKELETNFYLENVNNSRNIIKGTMY